MYIGLFLKKPVIEPGYYPKIDEKYLKKHRTKNFEETMKLGQFFSDNINDECDTFVANYEYDYWEPEQCKKIVNWIEKNQDKIKEAKLDEIFKVINDYCNQAVELDTGVEIDL